MAAAAATGRFSHGRARALTTPGGRLLSCAASGASASVHARTRRGRTRKRARLPAGNILFEKVRVLQADELDREAVLDMAHDAARRFADGNEAADLGPLIALDRRTRLGDVDDPAGDVDAARQDQSGNRVARRNAAVPPIFRQAEDAAVGEPGELSRKLVPLARRRRYGHGEAVL